MQLSNRLKEFDSSNFREVFLRQQSLTNPIDLSVGIPEDKTPIHIKKAGIGAILNDKTLYTPANGIKELRIAISDKLKKKNDILVDENQVTIVPGLTTGLLIVYMAILDPGDEIIVMEPFYPPYQSLAAAIGAKVITIPTYPSFLPDIPSIEASITEKTKAIVINSPNNPTGAIYSKQTLEKLAQIADAHDIFIISDEIYESFIHEGKHFSIGSIYPNTITMNGFSKEYAMTGWRLGYIAGPHYVIDSINELQQYIVFASSSIAQHAAIEAIKNPSPLSIKEKYRKKRDYIVSSLEKMDYEIHGAQGGYYIFLKTPADMIDLEFVNKAADHNLLIIPGRAFSSRTGYIRISYGAEMNQIVKGMEKIEIITKEVKSKSIKLTTYK